MFQNLLQKKYRFTEKGEEGNGNENRSNKWLGEQVKSMKKWF